MDNKLINLSTHNSSLYSRFMANAITASPNVQKNFLEVTKSVAETIKKILEDANLIFDIEYKPIDFWSKNKNKTSCFVDGGVDKASILSAAPLSIRAGSFIVKPNGGSKREFFEESMVFLGDLYDPKNELYDFDEDDFEEDQMINKKKDGARIIFEAATLVKHILLKRKFDYCFLHGPIEATIMPFSVPGFPSFTKFAIENMFPFSDGNKSHLMTEYKKASSELEKLFKKHAISRSGKKYEDKIEQLIRKREELSEIIDKDEYEKRHFINVYLDAINFIKKSTFPIYGIVETSASAPYIKNLLFSCKNKGIISDKDFNKTLSTIKKYKITDSNLFEIILKSGQALKPLEVKKQIQGFKVTSGSVWEDKMDEFPKVHVGYIKVNDNQSPIRVESLNYPSNLKLDYKYILAASKLLPHYGFPIGLNVVDKFAKIPNWMGRAKRNYYTTHLLKQAVKNKDQNTISLALKVLSKKSRSWANRPTTRRNK